MLSGQTNAEVGRGVWNNASSSNERCKNIEKKMAEDIRLNREMMLFKKKMDR